MKGTLGRLVGVFEVTFALFSFHISHGMLMKKKLTFFFLLPLQNQERKHRTYVYVLIVTEVLEDWEDSVNIGKPLVIHENGCRSILSFFSFLNTQWRKNK